MNESSEAGWETLLQDCRSDPSRANLAQYVCPGQVPVTQSLTWTVPTNKQARLIIAAFKNLTFGAAKQAPGVALRLEPRSRTNGPWLLPWRAPRHRAPWRSLHRVTCLSRSASHLPVTATWPVFAWLSRGRSPARDCHVPVTAMCHLDCNVPRVPEAGARRALLSFRWAYRHPSFNPARTCMSGFHCIARSTRRRHTATR